MKEKTKNRVKVVCCIIVSIFLLTTMFISRVRLSNRLDEAMEKKKYAENMLESEELREKELDELKIEIKTRKFMESIARDKFGLIYKNEIIFEPEN